MDVDLDVLLQIVAVKIENQIMHVVKPVANDDQRQLIGQFGFLKINKIIFISLKAAPRTYRFISHKWIEKRSQSKTNLKEILDPLRVVTIAFPTNPLNFFDLTSLTSCLYVLEVHLCLLTEVHNRSKEIE